ncbi:MAG TPA: hypothetical protein VK874_10900 [Gaiellaceae bacterium]|nr:hypothetical protein [Gaiellaceae bacterium]
MRKTIVLAAVAAALAVTGAAGAGVSGPAFYVDGEVYRTVGTPTDFSGTGAPAWSYDTIYDFGGLQLNVATAAPGDRDYNGGRWMVHALAFADYAAAVAAHDANASGDLDSDAEVSAALASGAASDLGVVKRFECPVIPFPRGRA